MEIGVDLNLKLEPAKNGSSARRLSERPDCLRISRNYVFTRKTL